jgi:uncharacterized membrane protein
MSELRRAPLPALLDRIEQVQALDRMVEPVEQFVRRVPEGVRRGLHGVAWSGAPLHPALVHVPLGSWVAASVMDAAHRPDAARSLTVLGVLAAVPTAVAGWSDWVELRSYEHKRIGVVHAGAIAAGLVLYTGSIAARCAGKVRLGQRLGLAGLAAVSVAGAIGGDLVFQRGANVNCDKRA